MGVGVEAGAELVASVAGEDDLLALVVSAKAGVEEVVEGGGVVVEDTLG